jgi:hypothetical protein
MFRSIHRVTAHMACRAVVILVGHVSGCSPESSPSSSGVSDKPAGAAVAADPTADATNRLRFCLERWKQAKDVRPDEPGALTGMTFVRPESKSGVTRIMSYTIGKPQIMTGEAVGAGMKNPENVLERFEIPVTYRPFDSSVRKEYGIEAVFSVAKLKDPKVQWSIDQIKAKVQE